MSDLLKDNRLPLGISAAALALATLIGIIPILEDNDNVSDTGSQSSNDIAALEERINALEASGLGTDAIPEGVENARLRQEIDLIVRGLGNQTGRVSRLKGVVEGITDDNGQLVPAALVLDEIALAKRGLSNLTRRINEVTDRMDALDTAAADIARLQQQMAIVNRAFGRVAANANAARDDRATLMSALTALSADAELTARAPASDTANLEEIASKLDDILQRLDN
ncbi:MAG: hypothetical protein ABJQ34_09200 [Paracoccaceae bacterium]